MFAMFDAIMQRLQDSLDCPKHRYLYDELNLELRMQGIVGARGVGKTTLLLQLLKSQLANGRRAFYFSADHIYFEQTLLFYFVTELYEAQGMRMLFIDEIHKYKNWNQELKNIYDAFPDLKIIFSGSSSIDLIKGTYDLSRRVILHQLAGLSFREYLEFTLDETYPILSFEKLTHELDNVNELLNASDIKLDEHFKTYLQHGYYPFYFEDLLTHEQCILRIIEKAIYEDIANFYALKTNNLPYFRKILNFWASIPPGEININALAKQVGIDNKTLLTYLHYLQEIHLIDLIYPDQGGALLLRKPEKIFLANTTLLNVLNAQLGKSLNVGTLRELFFIQAIRPSGLKLFYTPQGDYLINNITFEIGGKHKNKKQISMLKQAYLVKDNIRYASGHTIPLHYFGFLY